MANEFDWHAYETRATSDKRYAAKLRWPKSRALGLLITYYRTVDRVKGESPNHGQPWSYPVRRTVSGFYPGSPSFNRRFTQVREMHRRHETTLGNNVALTRWTVARMVREIRHDCRVVQR